MRGFLLLLAVLAAFVAWLILLRTARRILGRLPELSLEKRREEAGLCHACGYNLKGVPSYMCPECGIVRLRPAPRNVSTPSRAADLSESAPETNA